SKNIARSLDAAPASTERSGGAADVQGSRAESDVQRTSLEAWTRRRRRPSAAEERRMFRGVVPRAMFKEHRSKPGRGAGVDRAQRRSGGCSGESCRERCSKNIARSLDAAPASTERSGGAADVQGSRAESDVQRTSLEA